MALKKYLQTPLFLGGLVIKVLLILSLAPAAQTDWFLPFMDAFWQHPRLFPWDYVFQNSAAFPYGIVMFAALLPCTFFDFVLSQFFDVAMSGYGIMTTLILADICLYLLLCLLLHEKHDKVLRTYWFSPISLIGIYWIGQLDTIPVCFLFGSLFALQRHKNTLSGFLLAAACSAKLSMLVGLPFFFIYLFLTPRLRESGKKFLQGFVGGSLILLIPPLLSNGYRMMVLGTPEMHRIFDLHLEIGALSLYLTPVIYGLGLYFAWRIRRMTFELFCTILGLSFFLLVFSTPAPPGWYLWVVPFSTIFQVNASSARHELLLFIFNICISLAQILFWPGPSISALGVSLYSFFPDIVHAMPIQMHSIWISILFFLGCVVYISMVRENIYRNKAYVTWRRPMIIATAGDSGTGKDRLARSLASMFGTESVAHISGDDYHLWDRYGVMWQSFTHLHPGANNLHKFAKDVTDLFCNKSIACREYNHTTGRFTPPKIRHGNDIIIVSGLHALMNKSLRDKYDISIYLDMDESLRRWFKCRRDCLERGHKLEAVLASIERRVDDAEQFIRPQLDHADIVFSLYSVTPLCMENLETSSAFPQLGLRAILRGAHFSGELLRHMVGLCGMRVDMRFTKNIDTVTLAIEGELTWEDTTFIASQLFPNMLELLALNPRWASDMDGVMQLIVLSYLANKIESKDV